MVGAKRECPVDWTALVSKPIAVAGLDVTVDECPKCHGLYLDKGEIKRITGNERLNDLLTKHLGTDADSPYVCPGCGWTMDREDAGDVRVDVCLKCFGVWLDEGELDRLKDKSEDWFDPGSFSDEKRKELDRAAQVRARERKKAWSRFLYRLSGRDLVRRR